MGNIESFADMKSLEEFLLDKKARYKEGFIDWIKEYTEDNRLYITSEDKMISFEEIEGYI